MKAMIDRGWCLQVVKGLRGGVQDVALKMLIGETHYHINSFRQVQFKGTQVITLSCAPAAQLSKTPTYNMQSTDVVLITCEAAGKPERHIRVMDLS